MSFFEDIKEIFGIEAKKLNARIEKVENHLDAIRKQNDRQANNLAYDIKTANFTIPATNGKLGEVNSGIDLLEVPPGSYLEILTWSYSAGEADIPVLLINGSDVPVDVADNNPVAAKLGVSLNKALIIPEKRTLRAANTTFKQATNLFVEFKVYSNQAAFIEAGEIDS